MSPPFRQIFYMPCAEPLDGALQMAIDELLLRDVSGVILRDYCWSMRTVSIGYFGKSGEIFELGSPAPAAARAFVRRPTGGGAVEHGHGRDYTYSIVVSADEARALNLRPRASYRTFHQRLSQVLRRFGYPVSLADGGQGGAGGQACFTNPVGDDLMLEGRKIAGAGQKRSRGAILHQGSVQPIEVPDGFGGAFASALAKQVEPLALDPVLLSRAEELADVKYRSDAWNRRR
jgi:lipoate-protein ligase A